MSDGGYKIRNKEGIHFITFAVVDRSRSSSFAIKNTRQLTA